MKGFPGIELESSLSRDLARRPAEVSVICGVVEFEDAFPVGVGLCWIEVGCASGSRPFRIELIGRTEEADIEIASKSALSCPGNRTGLGGKAPDTSILADSECPVLYVALATCSSPVSCFSSSLL